MKASIIKASIIKDLSRRLFVSLSLLWASAIRLTWFFGVALYVGFLSNFPLARCFAQSLTAESSAPSQKELSPKTEASPRNSEVSPSSNNNSHRDDFNLSSLPQYSPTVLEATDLTSVGSDSMEGLVDLWVEAYKSYQKQVSIQVVSHGSATAAAALIEGTADLGPMSRPMKTGELDEFKSKYGFEPTLVRTAIAGVALYVSKDNPIQKVSFRDLDAIFSATLKRGAPQNIRTWGELGVKGSLASELVMPIGLENNTYPNDYFRQQVLLQGEFVPSMVYTASTSALMEAMAVNKNAIGYGEVKEGLDQGKILAVSKEADEVAFLPSQENLVTGDYPLGRYLNVYVVRYPHQPLDQATQDFLRFVLSRQGQELVVKQGLVPLPLQVVQEELAKFN